MHKNTFLVVIILAIIAALLLGVNIGKKVASSQNNSSSNTTPVSPTPSTAAPSFEKYVNSICGISFQYPNTLTKTENASGSAVFTDSATAKESMVVTCQNEIPRPAVAASNIQTLRIVNELATSSVSATLYHDSSVKDGTPIDILM